MVVATNAPWITLLAVFPRRQKAEAALEGEKRIKIFSSQIRACNILLGICISLLVQFSFLALACPCASNKWCCSAPGVPSKKQNRVPSRAVSAKCEGLCFDNYSHTCIRACIEPLMSFDAEGYSFMCCHPDAGWLRSASPPMMNIRKVELGGKQSSRDCTLASTQFGGKCPESWRTSSICLLAASVACYEETAFYDN